MNCSRCGHDNRSGARFCANCGEPLAQKPAAPASEIPAPAEAVQEAPVQEAPVQQVPVQVPAEAAVEAGAEGGATGVVAADAGGQVFVTAEPTATGNAPGLNGKADGLGWAAPLPKESGVAGTAVEGTAVESSGAGEPAVGKPAASTPDLATPEAAGADDELPVGGAEQETAAEAAEPGVGELALVTSVEPAAEVLAGEAPGAAVDAVAPAETGEDAAAGEDAGADGAGGEAMPALTPGVLIAERFRVLAVSATAAGDEYLVQDRSVCAACGAHVEPSVEEPYCSECGAYLLDEQAPFAQRLLRRVADGSAEAGEVVTWEGMTFVLVEAAAAGEGTGSREPQVSFPHGVTLLAAQRSDRGVLRAEAPDEDSIFALTVASVFDSYTRPAVGLYVVADGMGGHGDGEVASRIAVEAVSQGLLQTMVIPLIHRQVMSQEMIGAALNAAIQTANQRVYENAQARGNDMGTTLTMALVIDDQAYVANVGDSRTYWWHRGQLEPITEDHSAVYQLVRKGILQPEEIYTHPRRNEITRSLGFRPEVQVDFFQRQLEPHDALLLCCDGLWEMLRNEGIADVLLSNFGDVQTVCDALVKRANLAGGEDNISVVLVRAEP